MGATNTTSNQSRLLLSREMSHFLLRLQSITGDEHLQGLKTLDFGRPFITPFIIFDEILIDPSVGSFVDSLHPGVEQNRFYKLLNKDRTVNYAEVSETVYHSCVIEAANIASRVISDSNYKFPEKLQPDYLLETPLYLFFKESKPFTDLVLKSVRNNVNIEIEEIAFVFSACYSVILGEKLDVPVLTSRTGSEILANICSKLGHLRPQNTIRYRIFDEMSKEALLSKKVSFEVPDFSDIESDYSDNLEELIKTAIHIRNESGAKLLRRKISELVYHAKNQPSEQKVLEMSKNEVRTASIRLLESVMPSRAKYLKQFAVELILTSPLVLLTYSSGILGTAAGIGGKLLIDEIKHKISQRKYGWFYFIFKNAPFTRLSLIDK